MKMRSGLIHGGICSLNLDLQVFASRPDALPEAYQKEGVS